MAATLIDIPSQSQGHSHGMHLGHGGGNLPAGSDVDFATTVEEFVDDIAATVPPPCLTGQCLLATLLGFLLTVAAGTASSKEVEEEGSASLEWMPIMMATLGVSLGVMCFASPFEVCHPVSLFPVVAAASFVGVLLFQVLSHSVGGSGRSFLLTSFFGAVFSTMAVSAYLHRAWWRLVCVQSYAQGSMFQLRAWGRWRSKLGEFCLKTGILRKKERSGAAAHGHSHGGVPCDGHHA